MARLLRIAPELPAESVKTALAFYEHKLGFRVATLMPGGEYAILERDGLGPTEVDALQVVGVPARGRDRLGLLGRAAPEHDLVTALEQDARERRAPRARPDHEKPHRQDRFTKSIETGTPSRTKRSRSRFSTQ